MIDTNYIVAGMNVAKCEHCGMSKSGSPKKGGGNVFVQIGLELYERVRHDCFLKARGKCHKCKRISRADFIHPAAPKASEEAIRELSQAVKRRLA